MSEDTDKADAERCRYLRGLALEGGRLEAFVALHQLDYVADAEAFDAAVDKAVAENWGEKKKP